MKRLRLFGLLVTVLVLAFGLALGCDNGTTETDDTEPLTTTFYDAANNITITFSNKAIEARARAAGPNDGDYYQIKRGSALLSSGTIQLQGNGTTIKFIEDSGATFTGQFLNNLLTINDTVGGQALTVSASTPGTSGGGGPSTGPSGGGTSPSGGGGASGAAAKIAAWTPSFASNLITDQGFTLSTPATIAIPNPGKQPVEYAAGLDTGASPTSPWQKATDFNGLQPESRYAVWARAAAITASESADGKAYAAGEAVKGAVTVDTKAKGEPGASITTPFMVVGTKTFDTITITNPAVVASPNDGSQEIEYAISKTTTAPTSGWLPWSTNTGSPAVNADVTGFTGLESGTDYNIFARTAYKAATGGKPAYSAGTAVKGDSTIKTELKDGLPVTINITQTLDNKPANSTDPIKWGELYVPKAAGVAGGVQDLEYTYSTQTTITDADYAWWTPSATGDSKANKGTAPNVGLPATVTLKTTSDGGLVFTGILGLTAADGTGTAGTQGTFHVFARSKENTSYKTGTGVKISNNPAPVLLQAPTLLAITASLDGAAETGKFTVQITAPTNADANNKKTDPYLSTLPTFEYALGATVGGDPITEWQELLVFEGLIADTTYYLKARVKEIASSPLYAQGDIVHAAATTLKTAAGTTGADSVFAWVPAIYTAKGLQLTVSGGATVTGTAPLASVIDYGISEGTAATGPEKLGTLDDNSTANDPTDDEILFEGLKEDTTYTLWVRKAAAGTVAQGTWAKATGDYATPKTIKAAAAPSDLSTLTIGTRAVDGFIVGNVPNIHNTTQQNWEFAVTKSANTRPTDSDTWVTASSNAAPFTGLDAGTAYYVWMRSKADPGNYGSGTPAYLPVRGVTLPVGIEIPAAWFTTNLETTVPVFSGVDTSDAEVTIQYALGLDVADVLPNLGNGQEVEFWVGTTVPTATVPAANAWVTPASVAAANSALTTIVQAGSGTYTLYARSKGNSDFGAGPAQIVAGPYTVATP